MGRYSALGETLHTKLQCPGRYLDLGQDVWGDILHKGTSCPPTSLYHVYNIYQATSQVSSGNAENSHSQLIELRDAIVPNQQHSQTLTDASEDVQWFIV